MKLLVKLVGAIEVPVPQYESKGAVGLDLRAAVSGPMVLAPGAMTAIPTGIAVAIPEGYEGQIRARSGVARRSGVTVLNGIGTIDPDYRGELEVLLINHSGQPFTIAPIQRIAQLVISPVARAELEVVEELDETVRGSGGFGSTGAD